MQQLLSKVCNIRPVSICYILRAYREAPDLGQLHGWQLHTYLHYYTRIHTIVRHQAYV
jgi:hypothetical protein